MPLHTQEELRKRLEPYRFDLAIDLAQASVSRPLLHLSGAPFLYGVGDPAFPRMGAAFDLNTHDRLNHLDVATHSSKVLALIETLGAILHSQAEIVRRPELTRDRLQAFGIQEEDRFVIIHTGARLKFSHWPHYPALASLILERTDLKVAMLMEGPEGFADLPAELLASPRFKALSQRLQFDDFDTLLSLCEAFVGNDSGPKHLASLRGVHVVSLHTARINWAEWGQEIAGSIISRRVPCAGCAIFHDPEECGKDFACIRDIQASEVYEAMVAGL